MPEDDPDEDEPEDDPELEEDEEPDPEELDDPDPELEEEPDPEELEDPDPELEEEPDPELDDDEEPSQSHSGTRSWTLYFIWTHQSGSPFSSVQVILEEIRPLTSAGKMACEVSLWMPAGIGHAVCEQRSSTSGVIGM